MKETPWWHKIIWLVGMIIFKSVFQLKIEGGEKIPSKGGVVVVGNHRSYLDPIIMTFTTCRKMNFMAKDDLFRNAIFGYFITKMGAFPLRRDKLDRKAYQKALRILREGKILGLFPEGTRSISAKLGDLKKGSVRIALSANVPVVPVVIQGTDKILPIGAKMIRWGKIRLKVGDPIVIQNYRNKKEEKVDYVLQKLKEEMVAMGANE